MKTLRASKSDTGTIVKLNFFVQKIHSAAHPNLFEPYIEDEGIKSFFELQLNDQNNYIFLAYLSDVPVGYLWAQIQQIPETPLTYSKKRIYIHHVSVDEKYRGKGVGTCLMDEIKMVSKDLDIQDIAVDTWAFNKEANHFFQSQGYDIYNFRMWNI
jgi:ribosomal protein S18 acetylase RimI-like enzyme